MASGVYELDPDGRRCFRPATPRIPRLEDVVDVFDPALAAVREIDRTLAAWNRPGVVGRLLARLDAVHSSAAEGSTTTFTGLLEYETSLRTAPDPDDAATVAACANAVDADPADSVDPIDLALRTHRTLFEGSRDQMVAMSAGRLKDRTNGTVDHDAAGGFFYFTRPSSVPEAMAEWRDFTSAADPRVPDMVRQVLSHWMFEHIHPFADGNGRVGRLLVPLMLRTKGAVQSACAFIGEAVHEDKQLYVEALEGARLSGDMTAWTRLVLGFIHRTAAANLRRLDGLVAIDGRWRRAFASVRADSMVHQLAPFALTRPIFTIADAIEAIGGTFASVNGAAARLVDAGILTIGRGARRDRLFHALEVLDLFDRLG